MTQTSIEPARTESGTLTRLDHYRLLGRSGLRVSPLCLGAMTFGPGWGWGADEATSRGLFDRYADRGGNFVDTANMYTNGESETMLGSFLQGRRDRFVLATKYTLSMDPADPNAGGNHRKNLTHALEASLKRLQTDCIDLYWVHAWDERTPTEELMRALDDAVRSGKILYVGVSDFPAWKVAQANTLAELRGWSPFIALQIEYSLVQRTVERDLMPMAREFNLGVTPWSPLGGGVLTGKYSRKDLDELDEEERRRAEDGGRAVRLTERKVRIIEALLEVAGEVDRPAAQVALNWLLQKPGVVSPIIGARKPEQLEDNLACLDFILDEGHQRRLDDASAIEPGFPHDFLQRDGIRKIRDGETRIAYP